MDKKSFLAFLAGVCGLIGAVEHQEMAQEAAVVAENAARPELRHTFYSISDSTFQHEIIISEGQDETILPVTMKDQRFPVLFTIARRDLEAIQMGQSIQIVSDFGENPWSITLTPTNIVKVDVLSNAPSLLFKELNELQTAKRDQNNAFEVPTYITQLISWFIKKRGSTIRFLGEYQKHNYEDAVVQKCFELRGIFLFHVFLSLTSSDYKERSMSSRKDLEYAINKTKGIVYTTLFMEKEAFYRLWKQLKKQCYFSSEELRSMEYSFRECSLLPSEGQTPQGWDDEKTDLENIFDFD